MRHAIFIVNLLQDVNIVRPLAYLAAHELGQTVAFLVSDKFLDRDTTSSWERELRIIAAATNAEIYVYDSEFRAYDFLQGKGGVLVAGSESSLSAHAAVHNVFRIAPSSFLKITLQHGLECVGFLQNREHNLAHGRNVTFGADVVAGWCDPSILRSLAPSQQAKLCVTGPSALVPTPGAPRPTGQDEAVGGIICENLHSVRLNISGNFKASFMDTFFAFCERQGAVGDRATLRPHPGGQYVLKNNVPLPDNVVLNNRPMYDVDLSRYAYGISAPSSVLVDMVLAGIPTAVWQDDDEVMDIGNYAGLAVISTLEDWLAFERDARLRPGMLLDQQARFLERLKMPTDPVVVRDRFARLLSGGAQRLGTVARARQAAARSVRRQRLHSHPAAVVPQAAGRHGRGRGRVVALYEEALRETLGQEDFNGPVGEAVALAHFREFDPDLVVFCRYSGPHSRALCHFARAGRADDLPCRRRPAEHPARDRPEEVPRPQPARTVGVGAHPAVVGRPAVLLDPAPAAAVPQAGLPDLGGGREDLLLRRGAESRGRAPRDQDRLHGLRPRARSGDGAAGRRGSAGPQPVGDVRAVRIHPSRPRWTGSAIGSR